MVNHEVRPDLDITGSRLGRASGPCGCCMLASPMAASQAKDQEWPERLECGLGFPFFGYQAP